MAGGWSRDGAVNEQIEASIADELARMRAEREALRGTSLSECEECGDPIPKARRGAIPGVRLCVSCQSDRDHAFRARGGYNRRGSKDSQLK